MGNFLSCDWGTSSFRIRLADTATGKVIAEEISGTGIAATFESWIATRDEGEEKRTTFYLTIIYDHIKKLEAKANCPLNGVMVIISGMAASSIGLINLPYSPLPLDLVSPVIQTAFIPATANFDHDTWLFSGVKSDDDVMRGEETQLIGCIDPAHTINNELFVFPGTHSKHISVKDNKIVAIKTFMTGDLFDLLSQKSILNTSVEKSTLDETTHLNAFKKGVKDTLGTNLLHSIFKVRINHLLELADKKENFNYLSGLLIGTELKDLKTMSVELINLVCSSNLAPYYDMALAELGLSTPVKKYSPEWVDTAVVRGQLKIANHLNLLA